MTDLLLDLVGSDRTQLDALVSDAYLGLVPLAAAVALGARRAEC